MCHGSVQNQSEKICTLPVQTTLGTLCLLLGTIQFNSITCAPALQVLDLNELNPILGAPPKKLFCMTHFAPN